MAAHVKVDETSCGPFCQHPYCWYSNRRVERGLPLRSNSEGGDDNTGFNEGELPTLKVLNLLEDYGSDPGDRYPSPTHRPSHHARRRSNGDAENNERSLSAPVARLTADGIPQVIAGIPQKTSPHTPHQTPIYSRQGPQGAPMPSTRASNKSAPARSAPIACLDLGSRVKKVDMRDVLDLGQVKRQGVIPSGNKVYVWVPSGKDDLAKSPRTNREEPGAQTKVHPRDVTQDMIPDTIATSPNKTKKLKKKESSYQTPTGGRPYTHPARSPPPTTRRTLPQDFDDGIAQLLQLPRDVLLEILEHTKESDLYDKSKVSMLLEQLMPLIRFEKDDLPLHYPPGPPPISPVSLQFSTRTSVPAPPAPLHSSGILRQKKVTLLDGRQRRAEPLRAPPPTRGVPFFLDESAMSGITSSEYTRRERPEQGGEEDRTTIMPTPTVASEEVIKHKSIATLRGGPTENSKRKITSVSAKGLPPLQAGVRLTRPFNYTTQSFDLALSPLSTPDYQESEKPSSPYSGRASTVYVTVPTLMSDHTPPVTPASHERTPIPPITRQSSARYSNISSAPSDDFNALHRTTPHGRPDVFRVPYPTDPVLRPEHTRGEDLTQSATTRHVAEHTMQRLPSNTPVMSPTVGGTTTVTSYARYTADQSRKEQLINTASTNTRDAGLATPMKPPDSATSPYGAQTSVMAQASEKAAGSPLPMVTPMPSTASPDLWPVVDERDYMRMVSPNRKMEQLAKKQMEMILAPVAPPPSPEPAALDVDVDYDIHEMAKSTGASSLAPLAEEEEEDGHHDNNVIVNDNIYVKDNFNDNTINDDVNDNLIVNDNANDNLSDNAGDLTRDEAASAQRAEPERVDAGANTTEQIQDPGERLEPVNNVQKNNEESNEVETAEGKVDSYDIANREMSEAAQTFRKEVGEDSDVIDATQDMSDPSAMEPSADANHEATDLPPEDAAKELGDTEGDIESSSKEAVVTASVEAGEDKKDAPE